MLLGPPPKPVSRTWIDVGAVDRRDERGERVLTRDRGRVVGLGDAGGRRGRCTVSTRVGHLAAEPDRLDLGRKPLALAERHATRCRRLRSRSRPRWCVFNGTVCALFGSSLGSTSGMTGNRVTWTTLSSERPPGVRTPERMCAPKRQPAEASSVALDLVVGDGPRARVQVKPVVVEQQLPGVLEPAAGEDHGELAADRADPGDDRLDGSAAAAQADDRGQASADDERGER